MREKYQMYERSFIVGDMYSNSNVSQCPLNDSSMINPRLDTWNSNTYRLPYQNEMNFTSRKIQSYPQQMHYSFDPNEFNDYLPSSQSICPSHISTNAHVPDLNYIYPYDTRLQTNILSSTNEYQTSSSQDNENNMLKFKLSQSNVCKSPSCTSVSSFVPDDIDSSNSSYSDNLSISNENISQKCKVSSTISIEVCNKLRKMGNEQERNLFVDRLQKLWEEHHVTCRKLPTISRQALDLYRLYVCIREQNGFEEFSKIAKNHHWRYIASKLNIPNTSTASLSIRQKYINLKLFHYECKYDRRGIDPDVVLANLDKLRKKRIPKKNNRKLPFIKDQQIQLSNQLSLIKNNTNDNLSSSQSPTVSSTISKTSQPSNPISSSSTSR